jgi:organic hydroperoxide reductase OsmC/OhrA
MAEYTATVSWERKGEVFTDNRYSRAHVWAFDGGLSVPASASPHVVPLPMCDPAGVDPEEAFIAAISSCHMLWFLSIAAKRGFLVEAYTDRAVAVMERIEQGRLAITRATLRPEIRFGGSKGPTAEEMRAMHDEAHERCFIANSVNTRIAVEPEAR